MTPQDSGGERPSNRLAREVSPYLRQHAHNPVDWHPWGEEALEEARQRDKPILLSIGYSACHWCHVMERESFEDEGIAALMNDLFVNIKVDREERPDLDQIYQMVVQLMGRSGGWPLTVFLTPELKPFFGGTYFPPRERYGMPGFPQVLQAVAQAYRDRRSEVERSAGELTDAIAKVTSPMGDPGDPPPDVLAQAAKRLLLHADRDHGGFGDAPKFPSSMGIDVLLRAWRRHGDEEALAHVRRSLDGMRAGGIYDQLGGGFHRYAVDAHWGVPHFEKMLYDNALLVRLYVDAWRATGEARYADTARETLAYVAREMRSAEGGFYSAQDADSEGEEGKFFVWYPEQLREVLDPEEAEAAALRFGVAPGGNFEGGATVLHASRPLHAVAAQLGRDEAEVASLLDSARRKLFEAREQRVRPFRDEKVIASWNGLMIGAFAEAGAALGDEEHLRMAREGLAFVRSTLWQEGGLRRIHKDGESKGRAFLGDYADVAGAALDVHEATLDPEALQFAKELVAAAIDRFWDAEAGGFFFAERAGDLIVRAKDTLDNAVPSGASSICHALVRLHGLTGEADYLERAERTIRTLTPSALEQPMGFGHLIGAMDRYVHGPTHVVVVGDAADEGTQQLLAVARRAYVPNRALARVEPAAPADAGGPAALLEGRRQEGGRATAYVCRDRTCSLPVTSPDQLAELLTRG
ncbi:MAG: thioredoxin domain-containing protein [Myxococcota bacterium]